MASSLRSTGGGIGSPRQASAATASTASQQNFELYPNPARETLNLVLGAGQGSALLRIMDLTGRVVLTMPFKLGSVTQRESISVQDWPMGTYVLTLDREGKREYRRFVKQ